MKITFEELNKDIHLEIFRSIWSLTELHPKDIDKIKTDPDGFLIIQKDLIELKIDVVHESMLYYTHHGSIIIKDILLSVESEQYSDKIKAICEYFIALYVLHKANEKLQ